VGSTINDANYYVACQEAIVQVVCQKGFPEIKVVYNVLKPLTAL
jgi:hypothetical protein